MLKNSLRDLRNYFIGGLLIVAPIGATVYVVWGIFNLFDGWLRESAFLRNVLASVGIPERFPRYGAGFLATIILIIIIGFLGRLYLGRKMLSMVEMILSRIPGVSWIYNLIKQISYAFLGRQRNIFQRPVLIEYPRKGMYSLAFEVCSEDGVASDAVGRKLKCVFLATTPNPTSGYFLLVPEEDVIPVALSVEQAVKMVISSGMINPASSIDFSAADRDRYKSPTEPDISERAAM